MLAEVLRAAKWKTAKLEYLVRVVGAAKLTEKELNSFISIIKQWKGRKDMLSYWERSADAPKK